MRRDDDVAVLVVGAGPPSVNRWTRQRKRVCVPFQQIGEGLTPFPFVLDFAQNEHERLLISRLDALGGSVERRTELLGFEDGPDGIRATLRASGTKTRCRCAYLPGCDGSHSTVRDVVGATFAGGTYEHLFYVADVAARGSAVDDGVHVDLDASDLLAVFDLKGEVTRGAAAARQPHGRGAVHGMCTARRLTKYDACAPSRASRSTSPAGVRRWRDRDDEVLHHAPALSRNPSSR